MTMLGTAMMTLIQVKTIESLSRAVGAFSRENVLVCQFVALSVLLLLLLVHAACLLRTLLGASEPDSSDGGRPVAEDLTGCASDGSSCDPAEVAAVRTRHRRATAGCDEPEDDCISRPRTRAPRSTLSRRHPAWPRAPAGTPSARSRRCAPSRRSRNRPSPLQRCGHAPRRRMPNYVALPAQWGRRDLQ